MEEVIFKKASTTYYWSSRFFPRAVRSDVFRLYSFVRTADDYVDQIPQDSESFYALKAMWNGKKAAQDPLICHVVANMEHLVKEYDFDRKWVAAFLQSMEDDLSQKHYKTLADSLEYVYGSADVIGLMMAKMLGLKSTAMKAAAAQGRAMQWINFIRDIDEDLALGRAYFPLEDFKKLGLSDLKKETAEANPDSYKKFIQLQINRYKQWQSEAETGYKYIPKRLRIPVKTASDMYRWTAQEIEKDPFIVYQKKLKPTRINVLATAAKNSFL